MVEKVVSVNPRQFAVLGNPVQHSLSPIIHEHFARQFGHSIAYSRKLLQAESFAQYVREFFADGGGGLNVTVPFKALAHACADWLHESAEQAGAANTLVSGDNGIEAWNTDGAGLINDLVDRCNFTIAAKKILVLGAGGAAQGIVGPLLDSGPASVTVVNRTPSKAAQLIDRTALKYADVELRAMSLLELDTDGESFDLIINSTSLGLDGGSVKLSPNFAVGAFCYDLSYGATAAFAHWAKRCGAEGVADGLGMLVEQAALSYEVWFGVKPATKQVYQLLSEQLQGSD